ncbi:nuclear protein MDM1 isoform X2 [Parus major]|uniref:nuclear protein MDM1 isoform X2 n=1 Tax=Parus major TaxID=9157 RepID=UPI0007716760|nr:nuclear protein MDM1 isoform X2 [Parus major]
MSSSWSKPARMEISKGKAVRKATPEGRSEREGGLGPPDRVARSGEVAKANRQPARHRSRGSRRGLSEYKRNFKWRSPEFCSPSQQQKSLWAGLRSDQFGITREPKFISKRRVPYHNPQISKSLEWTADCDLNDALETEAAELHPDHNNNNVNQEKLETPEGLRHPPEVQSHVGDSGGETALALAENNMKKSPSEAPPNQNEAFLSPKKESEKMGNLFHRALQRKADINIPRNSEYQSQFVWKSPHEKSPILAAEQLICNTKKSIPPVKPPAITSETAYERNSKGSPVNSPQERGGSEDKEFLSKREEPFQKPAEDAAKQGKSEQKHPKQNNKQHISPKPLTLHTSRGKLNTEYSSKFLSPAQYFYKDGVWSRIKSKAHNEVRELRERAKAYRQRVEGTHFSRYHFNQILSDNNSLWDVSSTSSSEEGISNNIRALDLASVSEKEAASSPEVLQQPDSREQSHQDSTRKDMSDALTIPVERRLVWDEQEGTEERGNQQSTEEKEEEKTDEQAAVVVQQLEENNKDAKEDKKTEGENALVLNTSAAVSDSSVSSKRGSRHPTPKLRALAGTPRTHRDHATPAVGGTDLVSAPKFKSSLQRKRNLATNSTEKRSFQPDVKMEATSLLNSAPAGLGSVDPLPLRQDQWPPNRVADEQVPLASAHQEHSKSAKSCSVPCWSPSHRIQGTLKDPEFQHNGNLGNPKVRTFHLPLRERNRNDEDDRLSQISARSAASSSLASQILERAQKRKDFWGKA